METTIESHPAESDLAEIEALNQESEALIRQSYFETACRSVWVLGLAEASS